jgi:hypothetical protein
MRGNRRLLVAGVIAALVLLAVPVLAFASVWKDGGVKVTKFTELKTVGGELFETEAGTGMSCEIKATLTTEGGSTGKITSYETVKCPTGFGKMTGCELSTSTTKGLPWTVDVNTTDLTITNWHVKRTFKAGCATTELDKTIGSVTVTLQSPTAISEMELLGEITGFKIAGSLTVEGTNNGTYEIS